MKRIFNIMLVLSAFPFVFSACSQKEEFQKGDKDADGCYGVYFPAQENSITLDPADTTKYEIAVARTKTTGDIEVPYTFEDDSSVFVAGKILFNDGQSETVLKLAFPRANVGTKYTCHFLIEDPLYASKYSTGAIAFDFSVLREKWNELGKGKYTDDFVTALYGLPENATYDLEMSENDKTPGLYRLKNPYGEPFPYNEPGDYDDSKDYYMEVDASDAEGVYVKRFDSGCNWGYGEMVMWSMADYYMKNEGYTLTECKEAGYCGTNNEGVITFPKDVLLFGMKEYKGGALSLANGSGAFKVVLPGVIEVDYSVKMEAGYAKEGIIPVHFTLGSDVEKAKYATFEGKLNSFQVDAKAADIVDGTVKSVTIDSTGTYDFSFDSTGVYTIVAVTYDATNVDQEHAGCSFGYVAKDDSVAVIIDGELISTRKYEPMGYKSDNTLEFTIFGEDIVAANVGIYTTKKFTTSPEDCIDDLKTNEKNQLTDSLISLINMYGYCDIFTKLNPGTDYTMLVWATNGFEERIIKDTAKTTGIPLPIYMNYTAEDIDTLLLPKSSEGYFGKYDFFAQDLLEGTTGTREKISEIEIADSPIPDSEEGDEYVQVTGLFAETADKYHHTDTVTMDYYEGVLYTLPMYMTPTEGGEYYPAVKYLSATGGMYAAYNSFIMLGGYVCENHIAFVDNTTPYNLEVCGWLLTLFNDEEYSEFEKYAACYVDPMFVTPGIYNTAASSVSTSSSDLKSLSRLINGKRTNFVETDRGYIHSKIDTFLSSKKVSSRGQRAGFIHEPEYRAVSAGVSRSTATVSQDRRALRENVQPIALEMN